jgi:hypothetical protein
LSTEVFKRMYAFLTLVSALVAAGSLYYFQQNGGMMLLVASFVFVVLTVIFGVIFMSGRVNKTEDIHITE